MTHQVFPDSLPFVDQAQAFAALPLLHSQLARAHRSLGPLPLLLICFWTLHQETLRDTATDHWRQCMPDVHVEVIVKTDYAVGLNTKPSAVGNACQQTCG